LTYLESSPLDLVIVDTRALRFDAKRFCETVRSNSNTIPLLLILPEGKQFKDSTVNAVLQGAVTPRKLFNRVKRLVAKPEEGEVLRAGDLELDLKQRVVTLGEQQTRLTPRQTLLLEVFMRNPNRVLTRAFLMKEVWKTDFVDDTRTLEVHIHWLRKAIEKDPSHPRYLTTVRRVGYRFQPSNP
jgi:DNA-binding response OmpR family regulator